MSLRWTFWLGVVGLALHGHPACPTEPGGCPLAISDASVWLLGLEKPAGKIEAVTVSDVFFEVEPTVGTRTLVLPYPVGKSVELAVEAAEQDEESPDPVWHVRLEDGQETSLATLEAPPERRPEAPSRAVVLWPAPEAGAALVAEPAAGDLPSEVGLETVQAAIDLDGDARPDVLVVEFCCGDRTTVEACEYHCGEYWQRLSSGWVRCRAWQPA